MPCYRTPSQGAEIARRDRRGDTPLVWATRAGHAETVSYFLREGAEVDTANIVSFRNFEKLEVVKNLMY